MDETVFPLVPLGEQVITKTDQFITLLLVLRSKSSQICRFLVEFLCGENHLAQLRGGGFHCYSEHYDLLYREKDHNSEADLKSSLVASVRETRSSNRVRRTLTVNGAAEIFFEISGVLPPAIDLYDFAAIATLFFALRERRPLHIDGPVSAALLRNLEELQEVWAMWRPSSYAPVPVTA